MLTVDLREFGETRKDWPAKVTCVAMEYWMNEKVTSGGESKSRRRRRREGDGGEERGYKRCWVSMWSS